MTVRKEADEDYVRGRRILVSAPWVDMDHETEPVLIAASEKADLVADGISKFTREELQRVIAHLLKGNF